MDFITIIGDHAYTQAAMHLLSSHPYLFIFGGLIIGGETILLPVIYFTLLGEFFLPYVMFVMIIATAISDTVWYCVGKGLAHGATYIRVKDRVKKTMLRLSKVFDAHSSRILIASKFVYGTRIAAQVLAGLHNMPFVKYFVVNFVGIVALMCFYILGIKLFASASPGLKSMEFGFHISFALTMISILVVHVIISLIIKKKWFRS